MIPPTNKAQRTQTRTGLSRSNETAYVQHKFHCAKVKDVPNADGGTHTEIIGGCLVGDHCEKGARLRAALGD